MRARERERLASIYASLLDALYTYLRGCANPPPARQGCKSGATETMPSYLQCRNNKRILVVVVVSTMRKFRFSYMRMFEWPAVKVDVV